MTELRPIGYWLKELDRLINARFEADMAVGGLTRRHWQMLNSLADGPHPAAEVRDGLTPFWTEPGEWDAELAELIRRDWVTERAGVLELTDAGRDTHRRMLDLSERRRADLMKGLTDGQYIATVRTLERMAANMR
ncbi:MULTISPECIES: hypothetical protein [unclassified Nocardia]|uniref:hypothetical protein n=1 Tax=unclassified Nocardia TaxID=2637762 RepID=UPI001CE3E912|nr:MULTISPECIES: hypothetical protein [unclassified Nocardia]